MSFPTHQSLTQTAFGSDATAHLVAMPATVNPDDLLLVFFTNDDPAVTVTTPAGWTAIDSAAAVNSRTGLYAKKAVGDEDGGTVDFVTSSAKRASAQCCRISGWFGDIANGIAFAAAGPFSTSSPDAPSLNPAAWDVEDVLWYAVTGRNRNDTNPPDVTSYPASYTGGTDTRAGGAATLEPWLASARRSLNAASENPGTFSIRNSASWIAYTIAIRPSLIAKAFTDDGAEGAESFSKIITIPKTYSDAGAEGAEVYTVGKLKAFTDAGAEGSEIYLLTKYKSFSDVGAEGSELFSKTRLINPVYLK
ncbi:MAG: hypothetical protein ACREOP_11065, partial [Thermodesulfobacteriota bacterium]